MSSGADANGEAVSAARQEEPMLSVLAEGDGFVVVAKPPGRLVVPARGDGPGEPTVREQLREQLGREVWVVHRLDRNTSGVLLFATDADAHRQLSIAFERHRTVKHYWALVRGTLMGAGEMDRALVPVRGGRVRLSRPGDRDAKAARTSWRAVERVGPYTVVDFRPATGRLHQIRVHAQALEHPLAVDPAYGGAIRITAEDVRTALAAGTDCLPGSRPTVGTPTVDGDAGGAMDGSSSGGKADVVLFDRVTLHARALKFPHPRSGQPVEVEAPLADDLTRGLTLLRQLVANMSESA